MDLARPPPPRSGEWSEEEAYCMATPALAPKPCVLRVNLFDGWRQPLQPENNILLTVRDGNQKTVPLNEYQVSSIDIEGLPFFDNFGDNYTVVVRGGSAPATPGWRSTMTLLTPPA